MTALHAYSSLILPSDVSAGAVLGQSLQHFRWTPSKFIVITSARSTSCGRPVVEEEHGYCYDGRVNGCTGQEGCLHAKVGWVIIAVPRCVSFQPHYSVPAVCTAVLILHYKWDTELHSRTPLCVHPACRANHTDFMYALFISAKKKYTPFACASWCVVYGSVACVLFARAPGRCGLSALPAGA
ncbi:hypothetical protein TRVL_07549 [Trypanosoma vivax]|nr:hypothetical protein TRVL_07549 [Trypanosoma vivax]